MTAKKVGQSLIVTMALCLSTATGHAQGYKIFIMGGASSLTDPRTFTERDINYSSAYAGGAKVIAGVEAPFYKIFGIEASYGLGPNNLRINNNSYSYSFSKGYGERNSRYSADIVGHVPGVWRGIRAYGVVGVEYDVFSPTSSAKTLAKTQGFACEIGNTATCSATLSSQGEGGFNIGGGLDYKVASKVDLRLDVRDHVFGSPTYGLPTTFSVPSAAYFPISGSAHDLEYSIGIVYRFGKSK
jgi:opacity protein-like surface antigen